MRLWDTAVGRVSRGGRRLRERALAYIHSPEVLRTGNRITALRSGREAFPAMLEAIRGAKHYVLFETYIWNADRVGRQFAEALIERARAGVSVRALYDSIGCFGMPREFLRELQAGGVETLEFHPLAPWRPRWGFNQRDHQKILVVDGAVGFTGGINIGDEYAPQEQGGGGWFDIHVRVEGPVVLDLEHIFRRTWHRAGGAPFPEGESPLRGDGASSGGSLACTIDNYGMRNRSRMRSAYLHAIRESKESISLMNSYFLPDQGLRRAFGSAVQRGVSVRIIVPAVSDVPIVQLASRHLYPRLLRRGVRIFEWPERMMHAKTGVIDRVWTTIGSYNIDRRSFLHNLEAGLLILDPDFAGRMQAEFERSLERCREVQLAHTQAWPIWQRWIQAFCFRFRHWL